MNFLKMLTAFVFLCSTITKFSCLFSGAIVPYTSWSLPIKGVVNLINEAPLRMAFLSVENKVLGVTSFSTNTFFTINFDAEMNDAPVVSGGQASTNTNKVKIYFLDDNSFPTDIAASKDFVAITQWGRNSVAVWNKLEDGTLGEKKEYKTGISPESVLFTDTSLIVKNGFDASFSVFSMVNKKINPVAKSYSSGMISVDAFIAAQNKIITIGSKIRDTKINPRTQTIVSFTGRVNPLDIGNISKYFTVFSGNPVFSSQQMSRALSNPFLKGEKELDLESDLLATQNGFLRVSSLIASPAKIDLVYSGFSFTKFDQKNFNFSHVPLVDKSNIIPRKKLSNNIMSDGLFALFDKNEILLRKIIEDSNPRIESLKSNDSIVRAFNGVYHSILFYPVVFKGFTFMFALAKTDQGRIKVDMYRMNRE